jgi:hypothetical protein
MASVIDYAPSRNSFPDQKAALRAFETELAWLAHRGEVAR